MEVTPPKPRFRWRSLLQYRLRSLLLLATAIAVALAAWRQMVEKPYERQQAALDALGKLAERVEFVDRGPRWLPAWVSKRLRRAVSLHLERNEVRDEHLAHIGQLTDLERLYLARTEITDRGMTHLAGLSKSRRLSVWGTAVSDAGVQHLSELRHLEALDIQQTHCTQACLALLRPAARMTTFPCDFEVDDQGLADLVRLTNCKQAHLRCRGATLAGLTKASRLRAVEAITLYGATVDVAVAKAMGDLVGLKTFVLRDGSIDGHALTALRSCPSISRLYFADSVVSSAEVIQQFTPRLKGLYFSKLQNQAGQWQLDLLNPTGEVGISGQKKMSFTLGDLSHASQLQALSVIDPVPGADGVDFRWFPHLERLEWFVPLRDEQLQQVSELTDLVRLNLVCSGRDLAPATLQPLGRLRKLQQLTLYDYHVTDEHLGFLADLTSLQRLRLDNNPLRGTFLSRLNRLTALSHLELNGCPSFDETTLAHMALLRSLRRLELHRTPISDAGLKRLYGHPTLSSVALPEDGVTRQGRLTLRANLAVGAASIE